MESDPIGLVGGLNTYGYVEGNPLKNSDAAGLATDDLGRPIPPGFPDYIGHARQQAARQLQHWWNSHFNQDQEECEADCDEEKKARDALCLVAKARGGKAAQKLCLSESDRMWNECMEKCKKKFCEAK